MLVDVADIAKFNRSPKYLGNAVISKQEGSAWWLESWLGLKEKFNHLVSGCWWKNKRLQSTLYRLYNIRTVLNFISNEWNVDLNRFVKWIPRIHLFEPWSRCGIAQQSNILMFGIWRCILHSQALYWSHPRTHTPWCIHCQWTSIKFYCSKNVEMTRTGPETRKKSVDNKIKNSNSHAKLFMHTNPNGNNKRGGAEQKSSNFCAGDVCG